MDMSQACISAVRTALPTAAIVFDRFHMVKLVNEKLTCLRRELYREANSKAEKEVLKGSRWLLLKKPANLDVERGEWEHLQEVLTLNRPLALGYYLKEELCLLWDQPGRQDPDHQGEKRDDHRCDPGGCHRHRGGFSLCRHEHRAGR